MRAYIRNLLRGHSRAQTMAEYALILGAVAVVAGLVYITLGTKISAVLNNVIAQL